MLILSAIVAIFVYGMIAAMLGTILPELSERFHLTPSQNGTIAFAQALGLILASLAVGPLLDNEGKKAGLILGLALIAIALYALPRSPGYRAIIVLLFMLGVGGGIVVTGANALVSDVSKRTAPPRSISSTSSSDSEAYSLLSSPPTFSDATGYASATPSQLSRSLRSSFRPRLRCRLPPAPDASSWPTQARS